MTLMYEPRFHITSICAEAFRSRTKCLSAPTGKSSGRRSASCFKPRSRPRRQLRRPNCEVHQPSQKNIVNMCKCASLNEFPRALRRVLQVHDSRCAAVLFGTLPSLLFALRKIRHKAPPNPAYYSSLGLRLDAPQSKSTITIKQASKLCGFNSLMYFSASLFEKAGLRNATATVSVISCRQKRNTQHVESTTCRSEIFCTLGISLS